MLSLRRRSRFVFAGLVSSALVAACAGGDDDDEDACEPGTKHCACKLRDRCDEGLICADERCVDAAGAGGTAGTTSSGGHAGLATAGGASAAGGFGARGGSAGSPSTGGFAGERPNVGGDSGDTGVTAGEGGESGESGEAGGAGDGPARGGTAGTGGKPGTAGRGGRGGRGGSAGAGAGGRAGSAGAGASGQAGSSGAGGTGGAGGCAELTLGELASVHTDSGDIVSAAFLSLTSPVGGTASDILTTSFYMGGGYDGHLTGTFTLGTGAEGNYETCQRCVVFRRDADTASERLFFASSGQMTIAEGSEQTIGYASFTLTDVTLTEVTIDDDFVSTPVPDGLCAHLASASVSFTEADWTCDPAWFGAGDGCDCGCAGTDPDCENTSLLACEYCHCPGDAGFCEVTSVDPDDTQQCLPTIPGGG